MTLSSSKHAKVYLHGFPGGPAELQLFGHAPRDDLLFAPDRARDGTGLTAEAYFDDLAQRISIHFHDHELHLIGFSMGARVALEIADRLDSAVIRIDLVSPACPLDGSDHLDLMAGRMIYRMAADRPWLFRVHTAIQAWLAQHRPGVLYNALFSQSVGADVLLAEDPLFKQAMQELLRSCFADGGSGYRREIQAYVTPWATLPSRIRPPVTIWQGEADNWTPPVMAQRLHHLLPGSELRLIPGASHYSTLSTALSAFANGLEQE